ncbi:MAG: Phosphatidylglycerophosphatase A [candidate division CPR1 bacterium ADurb.Bin160]|uniref:Phosphatidylglycerophosphatase A n=1 Tax=candidate division CPR1 bacterium ADurb.Bin160 TaxID=1852826 RepID=A0A1V5ZHG6_9BACT|nr:MAG: Phosphatidylglycerophosphatase A [candidate division CPR1 bacterium ADurb.Bin160]
MKSLINKNKIDEIIVTFFFVGKIKYAPGTFGSLAALPILFFDSFDICYYSIFFVVFLFAISLKPISRYELINGADHSSIVIDEVIGMLIIFSNPFLTLNVYWVAISFLLFRLFDILKPFPINKINDKKGALFVIADDLVAGLFSTIILQILQVGYRILPFFLKIL